MGDPNQDLLQNQNQASRTFDAIVVGSGISGGWAAMELTKKGLKTLLLERGRNVEHVTDYPTAHQHPWEFPHRLKLSNEDKKNYPIQCQANSFDESSKQFFVNDLEHPYIQVKPNSFNWTRGYQLGGRSLVWGRQVYRFSDLDFEANSKDGFGVDWPIRYKDIAPWYDYVETFIGVSGQAEGLPHLPDGKFLPPMEMNCVEKHFAGSVKSQYKDRIVTIGRVANVTQGWNGRGPCQYRNLCHRGCPFGAYFSSNSATLPIAHNTGNLTQVTHAIVAEVLYDEKNGKATGVRVIDAQTKKVTEYYAKIIFLNASAFASTAILLQSKSSRFPQGMGNDSGQLGKNIMDHFLMTGAEGEHDGFRDQYLSGRRANCIYIPRFRNVDANTTRKDYLRGFDYQGVGDRGYWEDKMNQIEGFGVDFKNELLAAGKGPWNLWIAGWGETLPYEDNRLELDPIQKDAYGLPLLRIHFESKENELSMRKDIEQSAAEMLEKAGFKNIRTYNRMMPGGNGHEMGTARMGRDPKTSVLNEWNQVHAVKNVFVTDGACMTSAGTQNPSLTYMALTARACDYAFNELKKGNL